jgi:hypothetical protein
MTLKGLSRLLIAALRKDYSITSSARSMNGSGIVTAVNTIDGVERSDSKADRPLLPVTAPSQRRAENKEHAAGDQRRCHHLVRWARAAAEGVNCHRLPTPIIAAGPRSRAGW